MFMQQEYFCVFVEAMKNVYDLLKPGGQFCFSDYLIMPIDWQPAEGEVDVAEHTNTWADWVTLKLQF